MAKGLCPGVGQSCKKESVEKRGRERERPKFLGVRGKPIKPLPRACTAHEGTGHLPKEVLKAQAGKAGLAGFHAPKSWPWRTRWRRNLNLPGFGTKKCRVRELEKVRFRESRRPALHRNRSPLMS